MQVNSSREGAVSAGGDSSSRTTLEILRAARELIGDPKCWCQKAYARAKDGEVCYGYREGVVRWCSVGAIQKITGEENHADDLADLLGDAMHGNALEFNDTHSHSEVLEAWDATIAKLEAKQVSA